MNPDRTPRRVLAATGCALLLALLLLVGLVLPAEYGWDPLGTGDALGLLALSESELSALQRETKPATTDERSFELAPFESVEFKYYLPAGSHLVYHWQANAEVVFDMHSEPDGAAPGFAQSFLSDRADTNSGGYRAPFSGIHGWFWQNRGDAAVVVTLVTTGFYPYALEMRGGLTHRYETTESGFLERADVD